MNNLDLNAFGVSKMSESQTREVNGGLLTEILVIVAVATFAEKLFEAGYKMGADRAAIDNAK